MNALDYLKRGYSFVLNDDHPFRTVIASLTIPIASAVGISKYVYEEPATTPVIAPADGEKVVQRYLDKIDSLSAPSIAGKTGWQELDEQTKDFSRQVILDPKLSETDITKIIDYFNETARFKPADYLWLRSGAGKDMNFVQECRVETLQVTGGNIRDYAKGAEQVYACAIDHEKTNAQLSVLPEMMGGMLGFFFLLSVGGSIGENWERDFKSKKRREQEEKERALQAKRRVDLPPPDIIVSKSADTGTQGSATPLPETKQRTRTLNF